MDADVLDSFIGILTSSLLEGFSSSVYEPLLMILNRNLERRKCKKTFF